MRPAPLPEVAGPQAAVTVGYVAAVPPSLAVYGSWTCCMTTPPYSSSSSSRCWRAQEGEEARELEEVKRMEEAVVTKMQRLEAEVQMYAGQDLSSSRTLRELQSYSWRARCPQEEEGEEEEEEEAEEEKTSSCSSASTRSSTSL